MKNYRDTFQKNYLTIQQINTIKFINGQPHLPSKFKVVITLYDVDAYDKSDIQDKVKPLIDDFINYNENNLITRNAQGQQS